MVGTQYLFSNQFQFIDLNNINNSPTKKIPQKHESNTDVKLLFRSDFIKLNKFC